MTKHRGQGEKQGVNQSYGVLRGHDGAVNHPPGLITPVMETDTGCLLESEAIPWRCRWWV